MGREGWGGIGPPDVSLTTGRCPSDPHMGGRYRLLCLCRECHRSCSLCVWLGGWVGERGVGVKHPPTQASQKAERTHPGAARKPLAIVLGLMQAEENLPGAVCVIRPVP